MIYFRTWLLIIRSILSYFFSIKSPSQKKYYLAGKHLFGSSFRYSENDKKSFTFFVKRYVLAMMFPEITHDTAYKKYSDGGTCFYEIEHSIKFGDYLQDNEKIRLSHLNYYYKGAINGAVFKNLLLGYLTYADKILQAVFLTLLFIFLLPIAVFSKMKASAGLIFFEYIELANLIKVVKHNHINKLFYYSIYEKDSNVSAIMLQNAGVEVIKVTSLTPLKFWNKIIIADVLALSSFMQVEEVEEFKDSMIIGRTEIWGPESLVNVVGRYKKEMYDTNKKVIGFYSSAAYIRRMNKEFALYDGYSGEVKVLTYLSEYLKAHRDIKLRIFLKEVEKQDDYRKITEDHYKEYFDGLDYELYYNPLLSAHYFEAANLGIAYYSTVILERLYCGFKCLLLLDVDSNIGIPSKALLNLCAQDKDDFFSKIDLFLSLPNSEYFKLVKLHSPLLEKLTSNTN
ncbi:MAG: hypothetical protein ACLQQ4_18280 [Bacteroidia bacterium]